MRGFGTVLTGTLVSGSVAREQEVEMHPAGRRLRVRGIQVHGDTAERALAGQRTALNVTGIEPSEVARGMVLTAPGLFRAADRIECRLDLLASAKPLKHRAPVHFHTGTVEIEAEVRRVEGSAPIEPGTAAYVRVSLREPALVLPGDRFIVRMFSPVVTIGGGVIVDINPPRGGADERLRTLERGSIAERVTLLVREARHGLGLPELIARTGLLPAEIERYAAIRQPQPWFLDPWRASALASEIRDTLAAFHERNPLAEGMPKEALRTAVLPQAPPFVFDTLLGNGVVTQGDLVRLASHRVLVKQEEESAIERVFLNAGLTVPSLAEALARSGIEPARARPVLQILLRNGTLVRVAEDLVFHRSALERLRELLAAHKGRRLAVPEFKDLAGVSRKYAIPLLEYLDRARVTRREGDYRIVL